MMALATPAFHVGSAADVRALNRARKNTVMKMGQRAGMRSFISFVGLLPGVSLIPDRALRCRLVRHWFPTLSSSTAERSDAPHARRFAGRRRHSLMTVLALIYLRRFPTQPFAATSSHRGRGPLGRLRYRRGSFETARP